MLFLRSLKAKHNKQKIQKLNLKIAQLIVKQQQNINTLHNS